MCRWLGYSGGAIRVERLLFEPEHSLIDQSLAARTGPSTTNGDGFGLGWYGDREEPGVYRDVRPAWNDANLRELAAQVSARQFLAHVRATTGTPVQRSNCHPFRHGRWLLVHNGAIEAYAQVRRALLLAVDPAFFGVIEGTTDSELMFALALGFGLADGEPLPALERMAWQVERVGREAGVEHPLQMTLGLCDGERLLGVRYSSVGTSRTLHVSRDVDDLRALDDRLASVPDDARVVVSEPITDVPGYWEAVGESSAIVVAGGEVETVPFAPRAP